MRSVELAIYADALAGESASLAARAERARSRLLQAAIEKRARTELSETAAERLDDVAAHQLLLAVARELEDVAPGRQDSSLLVADDEPGRWRRVVVLEQ